MPLTLPPVTDMSKTSKHSARLKKSMDQLIKIGGELRRGDKGAHELPNLAHKDGITSPSAASTRAPSEASTYRSGSLLDFDRSSSSRSCSSSKSRCSSTRSTYSSESLQDGSLSSRSCRSRRSRSSFAQAQRYRKNEDLELNLTPRPPNSKRATNIRRRPYPKQHNLQSRVSAATSTGECFQTIPHQRKTSEETENSLEVSHGFTAHQPIVEVSVHTHRSFNSDIQDRSEVHQTKAKTLEFEVDMSVEKLKKYMQCRYAERLALLSKLEKSEFLKESDPQCL